MEISEHVDCFGDNRRIKDTRKIKLWGLKACCPTLFYSYRVSYIFPSVKHWNENSEAKLKNSDSQNKKEGPKRQASKKSQETFLSPAKSAEWSVICIFISVLKWSKIDRNCHGCKHNVSLNFFAFWKHKFPWQNYTFTKIIHNEAKKIEKM